MFSGEGDGHAYSGNAEEEMDVDGSLEGNLEHSLKENNVTQL